MYGGIVKERSHGQYYCYVVNIIVNIKLLNIVLTIFIDRLEALLRMIILRILNIDNNIDRLNVP